MPTILTTDNPHLLISWRDCCFKTSKPCPAQPNRRRSKDNVVEYTTLFTSCSHGYLLCCIRKQQSTSSAYVCTCLFLRQPAFVHCTPRTSFTLIDQRGIVPTTMVLILATICHHGTYCAPLVPDKHNPLYLQLL